MCREIKLAAGLSDIATFKKQNKNRTFFECYRAVTCTAGEILSSGPAGDRRLARVLHHFYILYGYTGTQQKERNHKLSRRHCELVIRGRTATDPATYIHTHETETTQGGGQIRGRACRVPGRLGQEFSRRQLCLRMTVREPSKGVRPRPPNATPSLLRSPLARALCNRCS